MDTKEAKRFDRLYAKSCELQKSTYIRKFVAPDFQKMIRAEAGAKVGPVTVVVGGECRQRTSPLGTCRCVTCGKQGRWMGGAEAAGGGMHCGHFIGTRRNSVIFDEENVAPQCAYCNLYLHGNQVPYQTWMLHTYGQRTIERLRALKNESVQFDREELVRRRIGYMDRLKLAKQKMGQCA